MKEDAAQASPLPSRAAALLPNFLTLCAILCGLISIRLSGEGETGWAAAAIFAAVLLDTADGYAARRLSAVTAIGAELDSLADFVNFGVATAMLLYRSDLHLLGSAGWVAACAYALATAVRLARFNAQSAKAGGQTAYFRGVPSTAAAAGVLIADSIANAWLPAADASVLMAGVVIAASASMLSTLPVPAPFKRCGARPRNG